MCWGAGVLEADLGKHRNGGEGPAFGFTFGVKLMFISEKHVKGHVGSWKRNKWDGGPILRGDHLMADMKHIGHPTPNRGHPIREGSCFWCHHVRNHRVPATRARSAVSRGAEERRRQICSDPRHDPSGLPRNGNRWWARRGECGHIWQSH